MSVAGKLAYRRWLATSFEWQAVRIRALTIANLKCAICSTSNFKNDVHHLWYREKWDDTKFYDTRVLCRTCHTRVHQLTKPTRLGPNRGDRGRCEREFQKIRHTIRKELGLIPPKVRKPQPQRKPIIEHFCRLCQRESIATVLFLPRGTHRVCLTCWTVGICSDGSDVTLYRYARQRGKFKVPMLSVGQSS